MAKQVTHLRIIRPGPFGGELSTTLCRRVRNGQDYNVTEEKTEVTCKFCQAKLQTLKRAQEAQVRQVIAKAKR